MVCRPFRLFAGGRSLWLEVCWREAATAIDAAERFLFVSCETEPVVTLSVDCMRRFMRVPPSESLERSRLLRRLSRSRAASRFAEAALGFISAVFLDIQGPVADEAVAFSCWSQWRRLPVLGEVSILSSQATWARRFLMLRSSTRSCV